MTKKHFQSLVETIHNARGTSRAFSPDQVLALADFCAAQNPRFDRARFLQAVGTCPENPTVELLRKTTAALRSAVPCLARAVNEGAFERCAAPNVGQSALEQCEAALNAAKEQGAY